MSVCDVTCLLFMITLNSLKVRKETDEKAYYFRKQLQLFSALLCPDVSGAVYSFATIKRFGAAAS